MTTRAYGKINLGLRILRKRPDGYHDLETVFHRIDLFDELSFRLHEHDILLTCNNPDLPSDSSNLCIKAANLLRDLTGIQDGVEISLAKNIPVGGGLGGGSTDAATTLRALCTLWSLEITPNELHTLAATLGSDVPYFLLTESAYATSRGEQLEAMTLRLPYWIITVTPPVHVSTAWAYKNLKRDSQSLPLADFRAILQEHLHDPGILSKALVNDFEEVVFPIHPEIRIIKEQMEAGGADLALMSGSGSSVFAFAKSEERAKTLMHRLEPHGRVFLTKPFFTPS